MTPREQTSTIRLLVRALGLLTAGLALAPGAASAAVYGGEGFDEGADVTLRPGDAAASKPARDLRRAAANFDAATNTITAAVELAAPSTGPDDHSHIDVVVGNRVGNKCVEPAARINVTTLGADPRWVLSTDGGTVHPASATVSGNVVTVAAQSPALAQLGAPSCAWVMTSPVGADFEYDRLGPFDLTGPPAPPPAPPVPPAPVVPPGAGVKPALAVSVTKTPKSVVRRGRTLSFKVQVRNGGSAPIAASRLTLGKVRGVKVKPSRVKFKKLEPGASVSRTLRVTLSSKAKSRTKLTFRATATGKDVPAKAKEARAAGLRATTPLTVRVGKRLSPNDTGAAPTGRIYWRDVLVGGEMEFYGYVFVNSRWVYRGLPSNTGEAGGEYPKCSRRTAKGQDGEGCVPWRISKSGKLTIDGEPAKVTRDGLSVDELQKDGKTERNKFWLVEPLAPGSRVNVDVERTTVFGNCMGIGLNNRCTVSTTTLQLLPNGQYSKDKRRTTTIDSPGGPFIGINGKDPTTTGLYEILPGGRIRMQPLAGPAEHYSFGAPTTRGAADPVGKGVWLGNGHYWLDD